MSLYSICRSSVLGTCHSYPNSKNMSLLHQVSSHQEWQCARIKCKFTVLHSPNRDDVPAVQPQPRVKMSHQQNMSKMQVYQKIQLNYTAPTKSDDVPINHQKIQPQPIEGKCPRSVGLCVKCELTI